MSEHEEPYLPPPPTVPPPATPYGPPQNPYGQAYYPPQYPYAGPPYGYPAAPYPVAPPRPGNATGSAVLAFITAGLLILLGLLLLFGSSIATSTDRGHDVGVELGLDGAINLVAAGLLIAGGVQLMGQRASGRTMLIIGNVIVVAASIYWLTRFGGLSGGAIWPLMFAALAIISISLAAVGSVSRWLTPPR